MRESILDNQERLKEWQERAQHNEDWYVLKGWWQLQRRYKDATSQEVRLGVAHEMRDFAHTYPVQLQRVLAKWKAAMQERAVLARKIKRPIDKQSNNMFTYDK